MKMRIRDNSIRLRLTRGEVRALGTGQRVAASIAFPGSRVLDYVCVATPAVATPTAALEDTTVTVSLPAGQVEAWADSEQVSIAAEQPLDDGGTLAILVEKDFACLAPREGEDESDTFAHPLAGEKPG